MVPPSGGVARLTWARFHLLQDLQGRHSLSFFRFFKHLSRDVSRDVSRRSKKFALAAAVACVASFASVASDAKAEGSEIQGSSNSTNNQNRFKAGSKHSKRMQKTSVLRKQKSKQKSKRKRLRSSSNRNMR